MISCSAGSSGSASTTRLGIRRPPPSRGRLFSKNRDRLLAGDVAARFLAEVLADRKVKQVSTEHFSVDDTLIEAWGLNEELPLQGWFGRAADAGRNGERDW